MSTPRCPKGQRRSRRTGLCESCPPGTIRTRNGKCQLLSPAHAPVDPQPYRYQTLPPRARCPPNYHRDPQPPHNCHSCVGDTVLSHVSGMCHPLVLVPTVNGKCPKNTRRRSGNCYKVIGDVNQVNVQHSPRPHAAHVSPPRVSPPRAPRTPRVSPLRTIYPLPTNLPPSASDMVRRMLSIDGSGNVPVTIDLAVFGQILGNYSGVGHELIPMMDYLEIILKRIPDKLNDSTLTVFEKVCALTCICLISYNHVWVSTMTPIQLKKIVALLVRLMTILFNSIRSLSTTEAAHSLSRSFRILPPFILAELMSYSPTVDSIHDILRDNGAFFKDTGEIYLIPVAFYKTRHVALPTHPLVPPTHMFDLEDYMDIPYDANRPNYTCIVIKDGARVNAFSVETDLLRRGINPRTPLWLFMRCKGASHSLRVTDDTVFNDKLYLNLSKIGVTQVPYVDINEIQTALDSGHTCILIQPKKEGGVNVVTQIASAYLYGVVQSAVSASHCEKGHLGGLYDVYIPT